MELGSGAAVRAALVVVVATLTVSCGSPSARQETPTPVPATSASPTPTSTPPQSAAPSLDVTPLIPDLASDGTLNLLHEDGSTAASFPASMSLELFSPFGNGFLGAHEANGEPSSLVAIQADGSLDTLQAIPNQAMFAGATGALDGHAWAWLEGAAYSSQCINGLSSGTLEVGSRGTPPRAIAQLPDGGATAAWSLGGWMGDNLWLVQTTGCPGNGASSTQAYLAHESGGALTPVQQTLGTGCALTAMALNGSMLCATRPAHQATTTWRFVSARGAAQNFSAASLGTVCAGHGTLNDFEGLTLSLDAAYISIDAGCAGSSRFDQLFIIATATGAVRPISTMTYLAADSWLPDGSLLCEDNGNPVQAQSYLLTAAGEITPLAAGHAIWSNANVVW